MKYKLFEGAKNNYNDIEGLLEQVLENREIDNPYEYLKVINNENVEYNPLLLDNIETARDRLLRAIDKEEYIHIIVD